MRAKVLILKIPLKEDTIWHEKNVLKNITQTEAVTMITA